MQEFSRGEQDNTRYLGEESSESKEKSGNVIERTLVSTKQGKGGEFTFADTDQEGKKVAEGRVEIGADGKLRNIARVFTTPEGKKIDQEWKFDRENNTAAIVGTKEQDTNAMIQKDASLLEQGIAMEGKYELSAYQPSERDRATIGYDMDFDEVLKTGQDASGEVSMGEIHIKYDDKGFIIKIRHYNPHTNDESITEFENEVHN
jgi:hypothetical protein